MHANIPPSLPRASLWRLSPWRLRCLRRSHTKEETQRLGTEPRFVPREGRSHGVDSQNSRVRTAGGRVRCWTNRSKVRQCANPDQAWPAGRAHHEVGGSPPGLPGGRGVGREQASRASLAPVPPSGCWSSWVCSVALQPHPLARSGPSPCLGAWRLLASQGSMPTTRSSTGP